MVFEREPRMSVLLEAQSELRIAVHLAVELVLGMMVVVAAELVLGMMVVVAAELVLGMMVVVAAELSIQHNMFLAALNQLGSNIPNHRKDFCNLHCKIGHMNHLDTDNMFRLSHLLPKLVEHNQLCMCCPSLKFAVEYVVHMGNRWYPH
ncbi:hypothetical protein BpHYR1_009818 [Brachionus plicatilis]|uniref:Uncharacterized protein n=1 Tax=Brachionus plicatilis TaxID=10195 RepID=A0A3M7RXM6_BRAPC|nr:hypothetical protein BpHYR1_009818 [Brachionus plicatilis]